MPDGFNEALIALLPNLRRFALSLSRRSDMADDLVQITVERALSARNNFDPAQPLDMWLFRILRNAFIDMTRRAKTRGTEVAIADTPDAAVIDGARDAENRLMLHQTEAAMARLPAD
ncbi:sigma-70 family RNA polymerase sigma factor [Phaeovulum sp.]|uniref:sigma-70 family RNA polymerase sigma factor n=1 Tax=Phaeovulum sp. TaxID=2934796 RepID=UPI0039E498BB